MASSETRVILAKHYFLYSTPQRLVVKPQETTEAIWRKVAKLQNLSGIWHKAKLLTNVLAVL
jgi:hypothetical protein